MVYKVYASHCLISPQGESVPGVEVSSPFAPLVFLRPGDPGRGSCCRPIRHLGELYQTGVDRLTPAPEVTGELAQLVERHGALVLNSNHPQCWEALKTPVLLPQSGLRVTLVGLGDVGATALLALVLLGQEIEEIQIYDRNEALCQRYALEMNQLLSPDGRVFPRVRVCREDELFACHLFLFAATGGVPPLGSAGDVRMLQYGVNRELVANYARKARNAQFRGLFCQISDPVDQLCRVAFLESNKDSQGKPDYLGLLPERILGFGLGVMAARAKFCAGEMGLSRETLRVYGPHGEGLICANAPGEDYDEEVSRKLTEATKTMNLRVRELGFKPYIAPGVSSAAVSVLRMVRRERFLAAVELDGAYFGCGGRWGRWGVEVEREVLHPGLMERIRRGYGDLLGLG
ncbi:MAG: lactate dehydrogenase [Ruminococcaceae bacterium]|nr:lactate dehydrogenase [Oscillospiraceae bacterium]